MKSLIMTRAKRCDFNNNATIISIFVKGLRDTHNIAGKVYEKDLQALSEVIKLVEKLNTAQHIAPTLSSLMVSMMSNDDNCLFAERKALLVVNALRCSAITMMILVISLKNVPQKIALTGTPHHHNISHPHSSSNHSHRDRSHAFHHRHSLGNCFDRSRSHHQSQHDKSYSHHQRHESHSVSHHNSHSDFPSIGRYIRRHSCRDTLHLHGCNTSSHSLHLHHT